MRIRIITEINLENGDYELVFKNLTHPGECIDYSLAQRTLRKVFADVNRQIENEEPAVADIVFKQVH